jgi:hypothetical protein
MKGNLGFDEFVRLVIDALEAAGVDYLIGGAIAAWSWGEPRATQDVDVVVNVPIQAIAFFSGYGSGMSTGWLKS